MSTTLQQIESQVLQLSPEEREELQEFLEQIAEDQLEMTPEFKASIERAESELAAGPGRVRKP